METIAVIGLGRLGLPLAVVLSAKGFKVIGIDADQDVVDAVNARRVPERIYEPGLPEALASTESLIATTEVAAAASAPISVILLPTPSAPDGSFSLDGVLGVCRELGAALRGKPGYRLVVVSSTVSPGSCGGPIAEALEESSGGKIGLDLGLCYCPEMVALGDVMRGFLRPGFAIIGESDASAGRKAAALYRELCGHVPTRRMSLVNAEIAKMAVNCFVATKIAFANELAELCEGFPGADVDVVADAVGLDPRVGRKCLKGATAYGGPCLPRDTTALVKVARSVGAEAPLVDAVGTSNRRQGERLASLVGRLVGERGAKTVGVLGLAFKPGTNVTEGSPGMALLLRAGLAETVVAFDPIVQVGQSTQTAQDCADRADVVVVATPCEEFRRVSFREGQTVVDCWRIYAGRDMKGVNYVALGMGPR